MEKVLSVVDLSINFHTSEGLVRAVRGIDFSIYESEVVGLVGESGCGKSVTSFAIMDLLPKPESVLERGVIEFLGSDLASLTDDEMQKIRGKDIAMIFQEPMTALNPVLTIGEQLGEVLDVHLGLPLGSKENKQRCIENLNLVGLPRAEQVLKEYPHQFSGGMRQRIMIAMALSCNPKLLVADEPTTALDVTIQAQILDLLHHLKEQMNTAILFITHDLGVIYEMANRVLVMYAGKIVEEGDTKEIFAAPMHPYTQGLMRSRSGRVQKDEVLYCIPGMVPSGKEVIVGCAFAPRCEFNFDLCQTTCPELTNVTEKHRVACHLVHKGGR
jgi:peptide/nickel transport system ATP-binding protein